MGYTSTEYSMSMNTKSHPKGGDEQDTRPEFVRRLPRKKERNIITEGKCRCIYLD